MAEAPNRIDALVAPDPNAGRFHIGNAPQVGIPPDLTAEETASLEAHMATIKVPEGQVAVEPEPEPEARASRAAPEKPPAAR